MLLRGVVVGVMRFVALVVPPPSSSSSSGLGQGALVLLLPVNEVLSLGKSRIVPHTMQNTEQMHTEG